MRLIALITGIVPGVGQIWLGRYWRGILLFFFFANGLNAFFIGRFLWQYAGAEIIQAASFTLAAFVWIVAWADVIETVAEDHKERKLRGKKQVR